MVTFGKQIHTLFNLGAIGAMMDRVLLDHFARGGEASEAAFATLVERHGPMVLRVCRQVLADGHLAEDAFQVTFLLLARRAWSIRDPDLLAGWLHRVARRVALRAAPGFTGATTVNARRPATSPWRATARWNATRLCAIVHEEIDRLSDTQRLPILLCALEGLSHEEAAQQLRWPVGTVKSRLVRGRRRLQGRLARRGLAADIADTPAWGGACAAGAGHGHDASRPPVRRGHDSSRRAGRGVGLWICRVPVAERIGCHALGQGYPRRRRGIRRVCCGHCDRDHAGRPARTSCSGGKCAAILARFARRRRRH